jgi:hypothetical protein
MKQEGSGGMSVINELPTVKINFTMLNPKYFFFRYRAIFLVPTVLLQKEMFMANFHLTVIFR